MNKIFICLSIMLIIAGNSEQLFSQATVAPGNFSITPASDFLGWDITPTNPPLNIKTELAQPINFYTLAGGGTFNNLRMIIYDSPSAPFNRGFVGIGVANPTRSLNVKDDIDLTSGIFPNSGYRWNDTIILKTDNNTENIFLGYNSGLNGGGGSANTFLGSYSGELHNTSSGGNTFVGWNAGSKGLNVSESVYVGSRAGEYNNGTVNCFVGVLAGNGNLLNNSSGNSFFGNSAGRINSGDNNTFVGNASGVNNTSDLNTFVGANSGNANTSGRNNSFLGGNSGNLNVTGSNLTFLGFETGMSNINGANNTYGGSMSGRANTSGSELTFWGFESGLANTTGVNNTFTGSMSGRANTTGKDNSFYGFQAGYTNNRGNENVFTGSGSGYLNKDGSHNTFTGFQSGYSNNMDNENAFYGNLSGRALNSGSNNTFIGSQSGLTVTNGSTITLIGYGTSANNSLTNATSLGANSAVMNNDNLILGDNTTKVGIGLSGNAIGPATSLEINTATPISTGNSGMRFRTLTSASPSSVTGVTKVLTVNNSGDVVLGDIAGSGGTVLTCPAGLINSNFITKITATNEICRTAGIFEMPVAPFTVGIGVGTSPNPWAANNLKMDIAGDLLLRHDNNNQVGGDIWMTDHTGSPPRRVFTMYGFGGFGTLAIGPDAGSNSQFTSGGASGSIYIGGNVGSLTGNSRSNTFIGYSCGNLYNDLSGENTFVGASSAGRFSAGTGNTFIGESAGGDGISGLISGDNNTFLGARSSGGGITAGNQNVFLGAGTFVNANSGDMNICIGAGAHAYNWLGTINNTVSIGAGSRVSASNFVTMGYQVPITIPEQQIGIGYQSPPAPGILTGALAKLYVERYAGGTTSAFFNGDIYTSTVFYPSDSMLKDNIAPFTDATTFLNQLEAKTYNFKQNIYPGMSLPAGNQIGLLAEDVEIVAPQLVREFSSPAIYDTIGSVLYPQVDFKAINYTGLIPVLLTAIKQQKELLDSLAQVVSQCCTSPIISNPASGNRSSIQLSNKDVVILNQNTPNPFNDNTEITYNIPESIKNAMILFYDQTGKVLQKFEITHRGMGTLTVFGEDLSSGIYTYTLLLDGKRNQTMRMIKQ